MITAGSPSARRNLAILDCRVLRRVVTAAAAHRSSISRSLRTSRPASSASRTSSSDVFPAGTGTGWPSRSDRDAAEHRDLQHVEERTTRSQEVPRLALARRSRRRSRRRSDCPGSRPGGRGPVRRRAHVAGSMGASDGHHLPITTRRGDRRGPIEPVRQPLQQGRHRDQHGIVDRVGVGDDPEPWRRRRRRSRFGSWRRNARPRGSWTRA